VVQLRLGLVGCAAGVLSAFDESDRLRLREPRPSNMLGSQEWRALSSVPQGGAGVPPKSVFKPATGYGFLPLLEGALLFSLANGKTGAGAGFSSVTVE